MADQPTAECVMCNKAAQLRCSKCTSQWYCGKKCQKEDWRIHKLLCSERQKFSTRPSEDVRRAIVFEENEPTVKFIWVPVVLKSDEGEKSEFPSLEEYFGPGNNGHTQLYYNNVIRRRSLKQHIDLRHREFFLADGSKPNKAVATLAGATDGDIWCGPLVALKFKGTVQNVLLGSMDRFYTDMDMRDLRDVMDYLVTYGRIKNIEVSPEEQQKKLKELLSKSLAAGNAGPRITYIPTSPGSSARANVLAALSSTLPLKGVRINCLGDATKSGRKKYEQVELPIDRQKDRLYIPPLPTQLGIPLELKKLPPPSPWKHDSYMLQNQTATFLNLDIEPSSSSWGWAPMEWQSMIGSVVAVRTDGKEFFPEHMEALDYYCRYFLQPAFEDSMGAGMDPESPIGKEEVMYRMSPKSFELFYTGFSNHKRDTDSEWGSGVPYPEIVGSAAKVKGLRENFHKLKQFL